MNYGLLIMRGEVRGERLEGRGKVAGASALGIPAGRQGSEKSSL